jgi:hypothetical protein
MSEMSVAEIEQAQEEAASEGSGCYCMPGCDLSYICSLALLYLKQPTSVTQRDIFE